MLEIVSFMEEYAASPETLVLCVDNGHTRARTGKWLGGNTDEAFAKRGIDSKRIAASRHPGEPVWRRQILIP